MGRLQKTLPSLHAGLIVGITCVILYSTSRFACETTERGHGNGRQFANTRSGDESGRRPIYVSLTTIVGKQKSASETVRSLLKQTVLPDKIILYISRDRYLQDEGFPRGVTDVGLAHLIDTEPRLELRWVENTGPYRKLIPLLQETWNEDVFVVSVDDDVRYRSSLLENFVNVYRKYNCTVAGRTWEMPGVEKNEDIMHWNYVRKRAAPTMLPQKYVIHTGKGGVLYHPKMFHKTPWILDKAKFTTLAPFGDDIWFNFARIANDVCCVTTGNYLTSQSEMKRLSLFSNYNSKRNDPQMRAVMNFVLQWQKENH